MTDLPYDLLMKIQNGTMAYRHRGIPLLKNPFDLAIYPLLLERLRPRTLIEIGSYRGGSAVWFADQARLRHLDLEVISVDLEVPSGIADPDVTFLRGDALSLAGVLTPAVLGSRPRPWLVVEDSAHQAATTMAVLEFFDSRLVSGDYIVIEDGILSAMGVADLYDGGPARALSEFLATAGERFEVDRGLCDYFGTNVTWNVDGYLRRR
jgi:cephalosporin hydroxylase